QLLKAYWRQWLMYNKYRAIPVDDTLRLTIPISTMEISGNSKSPWWK
ncbi:22876_t:CDS:2, partial [Gigaspora rosea]